MKRTQVHSRSVQRRESILCKCAFAFPFSLHIVICWVISARDTDCFHKRDNWWKLFKRDFCWNVYFSCCSPQIIWSQPNIPSLKTLAILLLSRKASHQYYTELKFLIYSWIFSYLYTTPPDPPFRRDTRCVCVRARCIFRSFKNSHVSCLMSVCLSWEDIENFHPDEPGHSHPHIRWIMDEASPLFSHCRTPCSWWCPNSALSWEFKGFSVSKIDSWFPPELTFLVDLFSFLGWWWLWPFPARTSEFILVSFGVPQPLLYVQQRRWSSSVECLLPPGVQGGLIWMN